MSHAADVILESSSASRSKTAAACVRGLNWPNQSKSIRLVRPWPKLAKSVEINTPRYLPTAVLGVRLKMRLLNNGFHLTVVGLHG
eukprot:798236-Amphidinium_carterae.1